MSVVVAERARAKLNLVLRVGPRRADGMHPLASLFASIDLADEVRIAFGGVERDEVVCPGVDGLNLAARALEGVRSLAPDLPHARVEIDKRIPVAAGLGGGSADAAAVLRVAGAQAGIDRADLLALAARLGSDVPSRLAPGHSIVAGTGELVEPVELAPLAFVLVPQAQGLATADVYAELDRMRAPQTAAAPDAEPLRELAGAGARRLAGALANDLEAAALSLRPELARTLDGLRAAGALGARITGSGPTAFGLFADRASAERAAQGIDGALVARAHG